MLARTLNGQRDQAKQAGIQGINLGSELGMTAIHREGILSEIVGADREEIRFLSKNLGHDSDCGNFPRDAASRWGVPSELASSASIAFASSSSPIVPSSVSFPNWERGEERAAPRAVAASPRGRSDQRSVRKVTPVLLSPFENFTGVTSRRDTT